MNRKAPLLPIFNCKKRSREAIIAEPQEQFVSSSHDGRYNNLEYSRNDSFTSQPAGSLYDNQMSHQQDPSLSYNTSTQWNNNQPQAMNNSSRYQFHHRAPGQCEQMQGRMNNSNPSSYSQPRNNQRGTGTSSMELIPPNPPNPKAARYNVNQKSVGTEGQSQYPRPSGRGSNYGRGSANKVGLRPNTNNSQGYNINSGSFNRSASTNFSRTASTTGYDGDHSSGSYAMEQGQNTYNRQGYGRNGGDLNRTSNGRGQDRATSSGMYCNSSNAMAHSEQNQWNSGSGYTNNVGTMPFNGSGRAAVPEQWNQWGDGGQRQPVNNMMGISPSMDRRYKPIDSSFQIPSATGDGAICAKTITNREHLSNTVQHPQSKTAAAQKTDTPSKNQVTAKPALDRSLRIIATDLGGIKNWEHLRGMLSFLFEIYAQVNSATVKVPDIDAKKFNIKEGAALMDCIFYEIDHSLPKLTRGKLYRIVGSFDSHQNVIKCVSVREALPEEYTTHQTCVQRCAQYKLELSNLVREQ